MALRAVYATEMTTMKQSMGYIFCDGACSGNGTARAVAGWAWGYWPNTVAGQPARHGAGRPPGPATNQRAELTALLEALRSWSSANGGPVTVMTDSMYAINCTSKWGPAWARKGWRRDSGEPLQNLDLIKPLVALWRPAWRLEHVRGHQTGGGWQAYGNNWVDRAAVVAAGGGTVTLPAIVRLPPITDTPVFDPDELCIGGTSTTVDTTKFLETTEAIATANVIEHVPATPSATPKKAVRIPGLKKPVYQTDIATWFGGR